MATIKMQGGKVVIKSDKVSCSCCCDTDCLYGRTAGNFLSGGAREADLPETVNYGSVVLHRMDYYGYRQNPSNPDAPGWVYNSDGLSWYLYDGDAEFFAPLFYRNCLINEDVSDNFADTYTVGDVSLIRVSIGKWVGGGRSLHFSYMVKDELGNLIPNHVWKWYLDGVEKSGLQTSPAGDYGSETVS
jgi:hypothetical protein